MNAPFARGACPALSAPMQTGDGLLVRLSPANGGFAPEALAGLAEAAERHGNGVLEVTARGSLQIRGLKPETVTPLAADIDALGIGIRTGVPVETGPLAGLDPTEIADPRPLAEAIRNAIAATDLSERLGPKVSVIVDGGGRLDMDAVPADVRLMALGGDGSWLVSVGGTAKSALVLGLVYEEQAAGIAIALLEAIAAKGIKARGRDLNAELAVGKARLSALPPSVLPDISPAKGEIGLHRGLRHPETSQKKRRAVMAANLPPCGGDVRQDRGGREGTPAQQSENFSPIGSFNLAPEKFALGIGLPFGQIDASKLAAFCRVAQAAGITEIRLAPGRAILLLGLGRAACTELQAAAVRYGFIIDPADRRTTIAACPGAPACASGHIAARAIAEQLAALGDDLFDRSLALHVSGCAKGCAHPAPADLAFVGHPDGIGLVIGGKASDVVAMRLHDAEIRHGFGRLAGLYREAKRPGESAGTCLSRLGPGRVAAAFHQG